MPPKPSSSGTTAPPEAELLARFNQNPFAPFLFVQHRVPGSPDSDPRYQKGVLDFVLIAYYIVFWSLCRILIAGRLFTRIGRFYGLKKEGKLDRVGEQGYAIVYYTASGLWGLVCTSLARV